MSAENDLALAYHMGYDDALAKRKPDASKAQVLAPYDLAAENAKLRELVRLMVRRHTPISPCKNIPCGECPVKDECDQEDALMRELGVEVDE